MSRLAKGNRREDPCNHGRHDKYPCFLFAFPKIKLTHRTRETPLSTPEQHYSGHQGGTNTFLPSTRTRTYTLFINILTTSTRRATSQHRLAASKSLIKCGWGGMSPSQSQICRTQRRRVTHLHRVGATGVWSVGKSAAGVLTNHLGSITTSYLAYQF